MLTLLRRLRHNRAGNIAVMTAMLMVQLVGAAGGALDFGRLQMVHARLQDAADAASVGAVAMKSKGMIAAAAMTALFQKNRRERPHHAVAAAAGAARSRARFRGPQR